MSTVLRVALTELDPIFAQSSTGTMVMIRYYTLVRYQNSNVYISVLCNACSALNIAIQYHSLQKALIFKNV